MENKESYINFSTVLSSEPALKTAPVKNEANYNSQYVLLEALREI